MLCIAWCGREENYLGERREFGSFSFAPSLAGRLVHSFLGQGELQEAGGIKVCALPADGGMKMWAGGAAGPSA